MKRYKYRKVTPELLKEIEKARDEGLTLKRLAMLFNLSTSTIRYYLVPSYREKVIKRAKENPKGKLSQEKQQTFKEYSKKYFKERYKTDEEFRTRVIGHVKRYKSKLKENE